MKIVLPFQPTKGVAFKVPFELQSETSPQSFISNEGTAIHTTVSKDYNAFSNTTNTYVYIGKNSTADSSHYYIELTAEEMDADVIMVTATNWGGGTGQKGYVNSIIIYTSGFTGFASGGGATAQEVWEYATRTITSSPADALDVGDIQSLQAFIKKYAAGFTEKQLLALLVKQLKNS